MKKIGCLFLSFLFLSGCSNASSHLNQVKSNAGDSIKAGKANQETHIGMPSIKAAEVLGSLSINDQIDEAARNNNIQKINELISRVKDLNAKDSTGMTPLTCAASRGNIETIKLLLSKGVDVNAKDSDGWTPLIYAAHIGNTETVKLLLGKGVDVNVKANHGKTALAIAAESMSPTKSDIVKLLRKAGAK